MVKLSKRMESVVGLLSVAGTVADIGCDHAHVSIYLIENKIADHVIAMDVGKGPLMRAKENIAACGLSEVIETRLSDGGEKLILGEADSAIIAGMGGMLMLKILKASEDKFQHMNELVLQPQSDLPYFRRTLDERGYEIIKEDMVYEDDKFYPMMKVKYTGHTECLLTEVECTYGPKLLREKHSVLKEYLKYEESQRKRVYDNLILAPQSQKIKERIAEILKEKSVREEAMGVFV